jgi:hypothetical protein
LGGPLARFKNNRFGSPMKDVIKDITTRMTVQDLTSFLPAAEDVLACELPKLGEILLLHLNSWKDQGKVWQPGGGLNRLYFVQAMEGTERGLGPPRRNAPEYGVKQPAVTERMQEAWNWLDKQGLLMHNHGQPSSDWFLITSAGKEFLARIAQLEEVEKLLGETHQGRREPAWWGRARSVIEHWNPARNAEAKAAEDLFFANFQAVGRAADERRRGENPMLALLNQAKHGLSSGQLRRVSIESSGTLIAESRLEELRGLMSADFDFTKLIRLCEELKIAAREECHFATAMLTRGLLDHVPPVFGKATFSEVANNYGGRSFKELMQPLDGIARKVADWYLHGQIRRRETLPAAQQVRFAASLDMLLSEIVRKMQEQGLTP